MTQPPRYYAFARNATLCRYLNCCERTLQKYLGELIQRGEITVENGEGGRQLRKIKVARLQPLYPAEPCGVNPAEPCGGINNEKKNKRKKMKGESSSAQSDGDKPASMSAEEIRDYYCAAIAHLDLNANHSTTLVDLFEKFVENRAAMGKEKLIVNTRGKVDYTLNRVKSFCDRDPKKMIYLLGKAVDKGWETVYPWKQEYDDDFRAMFGIPAPEQEDASEESRMNDEGWD